MARLATLNFTRVEDASRLPPLPEHEIAEWVENHLGDSGAVEFYCAQAALEADREKLARHYFQASAEGFTPAFIKYADFLLEEGNEEEVTPILAKGASAGCPQCRGALAAMYFAENPHSPV